MSPWTKAKPKPHLASKKKPEMDWDYNINLRQVYMFYTIRAALRFVGKCGLKEHRFKTVRGRLTHGKIYKCVMSYKFTNVQYKSVPWVIAVFYRYRGCYYVFFKVQDETHPKGSELKEECIVMESITPKERKRRNELKKTEAIGRFVDLDV